MNPKICQLQELSRIVSVCSNVTIRAGDAHADELLRLATLQARVSKSIAGSLRNGLGSQDANPSAEQKLTELQSELESFEARGFRSDALRGGFLDRLNDVYLILGPDNFPDKKP